jgi:hypothetical protein
MRTNRAFRLRTFDEAPITFDPTYKYNPGTNDYDSSEKKRIPAWCDRILFSKNAHGRIKNIDYRRYETTVSDHRPISAGFRVTLKAVEGGRMNVVRGEVEKEWKGVEKELLDSLRQAFAVLL